MKMQGFFAAVALFATMLPANAQRAYPEGAAPTVSLAATDPLLRIYRISGVRDTGAGDEVGVATSFHCTSASTVDETLRIVVRNFDDTLVASRAFVVHPRDTLSLATHFTKVFVEDFVLSRGVIIKQGSAEITATSANIFCSAMIVDAGSASPLGIALHMVRFNAAAGSQE